MKKANSLNSLEKALEKFLARLKNENRSNNTIIAYQNDIQQLIAFLEKKKISNIPDVTQNYIEEFKKHLSIKQKYTNKTVSRKLNSLKSFFRFLVNSQVIKKDPAAAVPHPKIVPKLPRILLSLEYRALRDACRDDNRTYAIVELMLQAGLRISEVANLELNDIQEDKLIIKPYESHSDRVVPLNRAAREAIKRYTNERPDTRKSQNLFITKNGHPLLIRNIRNSINRYFKIAEIENAYVNNLRDTFIVNQLEAGIPLNVISKIIGHKRVSSTEKYLSLVKNREGTKIKLKEL